MKKVEDIIRSLSDKEAKNFISFVNRMRTSQKESKIVQLFEAYYHQTYKNNEQIILELFPGMSKNAFYRLRNRLLDEVQQILLVQYSRMDDELVVHRMIMLARIAFNKDDYSSAHTLLLEAEKKALKIEAYELAMIIYKELISMSSLVGMVNSHTYIEKRREIRLKHNNISELRYLLASVTFKLTESIHNSKTEKEIVKALREIKDKLLESDLAKTSFNVRYNVHQSIVSILYEEKKYDLLLEHLIKGYEEFMQSDFQEKANHRRKIVSLSWIIAAYHWLLRIPESILYLDEMREALTQYDGILEDKFKPFYVTYQNSVYFHTRQLDKSLKTLDRFTEEYLQGRDIVHLSELPQSVLVGHFGRLVQTHFAKEGYDNALKQLSPCYITEIHDKLPREFRMEIAIMEAIIYFEKKEYKYALDHLRRTKRMYKKLLAEPKNIIFKSFLTLLNMLVKNGGFDLSKEQQNSIDAFIKTHPRYGEPFEKCINYKVWLEAKIREKGYYDVVIEYAEKGTKSSS